MAERLLWNKPISHGEYGDFPTSEHVCRPLATGEKLVVDLGVGETGKLRRRNFTAYPQIALDDRCQSLVFLTIFRKLLNIAGIVKKVHFFDKRRGLWWHTSARKRDESGALRRRGVNTKNTGSAGHPRWSTGATWGKCEGR